MGIVLKNPIIMGASNMTTDPGMLKKAEDQGIAAVVYKSLFEEQIQLEKFQMNSRLTEFNDIHAEMLTTHPSLNYSGPEEHLNQLRKARESLSVPLIASLNAVNDENWLEYARLLVQTGVDGLELNFYQIPSDFDRDAAAIESEQIRIAAEICRSNNLPVSVKLSPEYTNVLNFIKKLDQEGIKGVVLFNSFFQPDIDVKTGKHIKSFNFSHAGDYKKSLRTAGLLFGHIQADICSSKGIFSGADIIKMILSGASCVQVVSTLYKNGLEHIGKMQEEISDWMDEKSFGDLSEFRGILSKKNLRNNPFVYERAQYADLLINSENIFGSNR